MPHFAIECSESVLGLADPEELMRSVYDAAEATGLFAHSGTGGIKVRINRYRDYLNVDAQEHFVHVFAYIMEGRSQDQKQALAEAVVRALDAILPSVEIISVDISDFERSTYRNATMLRNGEDDPG